MPKTDRSTKILTATALFFFLAAVAGALLRHSSVPLMDMWDGYVNFYINLLEGHDEAWWQQHNEHKVVVSRLLFWLDHRLFDGSMYFLVLTNLLLALLCFATLNKLLHATLPPEAQTARWSLGCLLLILCFSWAQKDNFYSPFQSQFFLALLLPLLAFSLLARAVQQENMPLFLLAAVTGVAATFTMANGMATLPFMILLALLLKAGRKKTLLLCAVCAAALFVYLHDYQTAASNYSLTRSLLQRPLQVLAFVCIYLGNPLTALSGSNSAIPFFGVAGATLIALTLHASWQTLQNPRDNWHRLALVIFIAYIGATATGTAAGRLYTGISEAATSRYVTPAIMAWCALLILYAAPLARLQAKKPAALLLLPLLLLPAQVSALRWKPEPEFQNRVAALALALGIADREQLEKLYPAAERILPLAGKALHHQVSVFGKEPFQGLQQKIGKAADITAPGQCAAVLQDIRAIPAFGDYRRIYGSFTQPPAEGLPADILITDDAGIVVGAAIVQTSNPFPRSKRASGTPASGFQGYVLANASRNPLHIATARCVSPELLHSATGNLK